MVSITANFHSRYCALEFVVWSPWIHLLPIVLVLHSSFRVEQKRGIVIAIIKILQNDVACLESKPKAKENNTFLLSVLIGRCFALKNIHSSPKATLLAFGIELII